MDQASGEAGEALGIALADADLAQDDLSMGPGQVEDAVAAAPVRELVEEVVDGAAVLGRAEDDVDQGGPFRGDLHHATDGHRRIEDRSHRSVQRTALAQGGRYDGAIVAAKRAAEGANSAVFTSLQRMSADPKPQQAGIYADR